MKDDNIETVMKTVVNDIMTKTTKLPKEIIHLFNTKEIDEDWSFVEYKPSDTGKWTHDYHRYPAKFIPQLVERLIDEYISLEDAHINDPFMGCGTTIVTALSRGFKTSGTDINKIAYFINDYLRLGIPDRRVSFRAVWYQSSRDKTIREQILATENFSLNALFSLHQDFEDGEFKNLKLTRDALTHRFVNVKLFYDKEDVENMSENSLVSLTLELARATRNAILYLLQFVHAEEVKKERESTGFIPTLYAQEIPDELK